MTVDLPGYEANHNHPGVWCPPTGIKRTKGSKGSAQILAACHEWSVVKPSRRTSRVTDTFPHFLLWTQSNHNSPCKVSVTSPNLNFSWVKAFRCSLQKACSGRWGTWRRDITSITSLSEDTFVNFIAHHRTIIFISNLWVILETLLCHHTTVRRKVLTFYIWRLCFTVPAFLLSEEENIQEELGPGSGTCSLCLWTQLRTMEDREKKPFCTMAGLKHSFLPLQLHLNPSCLANSTCTLNF